MGVPIGHQVGYWVLVVIGFGFLIFVHELGHFLAAKSVGVRVVRFALGFGPRLFGTNKYADHEDAAKRVDRTDYCLCLIPCGGYVKMAGGEGMEPGEATGAADEFPAKSPGRRAWVVAAGPVMSVAVALPILFLLFLAGMPRPSSRINHILPGGPAWNAGLKRGDLITGFKEQGEESWRPVRLWREVKLNAALKDKVGDIVLRIERNGETRHVELTTMEETHFIGVSSTRIGPDEGYVTTTVGLVPKNSSAAAAGIRSGSRLLAIDGRTVHKWSDLEEAVFERPGEELEVTFSPPDSDEVRTTTLLVKAQKFFWLGIHAERRPRVDRVRPGFPAERAGLRPGDEITHVDGTPYTTWQGVRQAVMNAGPREITLTVRRGTGSVELTARLEQGEEIGDVLGLSAVRAPTVTGFAEDCPDETRRIPVGARLVQIGTLRLRSGGDVLWKYDADKSPDPVTLTYETGRWDRKPVIGPLDGPPGLSGFGPPADECRAVDVTPVEGTWGVVDFSPRIDKCRVVEPGRPGAALAQAVLETGQWIRFAGRSLWLLVTAQLPFKLLSGPVMILTASRYQAEAGLFNFFEFLVIITVHLGVINLVPFPILDGGHLGFLALEKIRRRPLPERVMAGLMYGGMALLIALMVFVTRNDIVTLIKLAGN